jgi:hypothetical protein
MPLARPVPVRVTREREQLNRHPIWSPDATQILSLYQGRGIGTYDLVTTTLASGDSVAVRQSPNFAKPMGWTRDGQLVWIESPVAGKLVTVVWRLPPGGQPLPVIQDDALTLEARVSSDGHWMAFSSNRSGRSEIEVTTFPERGPRYPVSVDGGGFPRWRADGRELYFLSQDSRLMAASFSPGSPPAIGTPTPLFEVRLIAHPDRSAFAAYEYDVTADGSRFLVNRMVSAPETSLTVITGWAPPR